MSTAGVQVATPPAPSRSRSVSAWRRVAIVLLLVVVGILTPLSIAGVWVRNQILDDDTYVNTVAPLSSDPAIQASVANFVTAQILDNVDVSGLASDALPPRAQFLVQPLTTQVRNFVSTVVLRVVQSDQFSAAWRAINRVAHHQVVDFLLDRGPVTLKGNSLVLDVGTVVQQAQQRLAAAGFDAAERIPSDRINRQLVIADAAALVRARDAIRLLQGITLVLPFATIGLLALAVFLAADRRRTLLIGVLVMAAATVLLAIGLNLARSAYLDQMASRPNLAPGAAAAIFDTIVRFLRDSIRTVFTVCMLVALWAFLSGPSGVAVRVRRRGAAVITAMRDRVGREDSPAAVWIGAHRTLLRVLSVTLAALLLVFLERPGPAVVLGIAAGLVVVFAGIEVMGQRGTHITSHG